MTNTVSFENHIQKLNKAELTHIITDIVGRNLTEALLLTALLHQSEGKLKCYTCQGLAYKLHINLTAGS